MKKYDVLDAYRDYCIVWRDRIEKIETPQDFLKCFTECNKSLDDILDNVCKKDRKARRIMLEGYKYISDLLFTKWGENKW